ncbi:hypothetical protein HDU91_000884 [Kappamyces sp. JEL0680]|nr:hypothetical protein HDU91_000884 [Kappamyces sp. JEL0680]
MNYYFVLRKRRLSNVTEKLWVVVTYIAVVIYLGVCAFNYTETRFAESSSSSSSTKNIDLMRTVYYIVVTISTVGYGDIYPSTHVGRAIVCVMIITAVATFPILLNQLIEAVSLAAYRGENYVKKSNPFVVICGDFSDAARTIDVVSMITRRDAAEGKITEVVLLGRHEPSNALKYALGEKRLLERVVYIQGNGTTRQDLARVSLKKASAAFILNKRHHGLDKVEDDLNMLRATMFDRFAPSVNLFVQTMASKRSFDCNVMTGAVHMDDWNQTLLSFNCQCPGFSTLFANLLHSQATLEHFSTPWHVQYNDGAANELFRIEIPLCFHGRSFPQVSFHLFRHCQIILIAVDAYNASQDTYRVLLNPGKNYLLRPGDFGYVVAHSNEDLKAVLKTVSEATFTLD